MGTAFPLFTQQMYDHLTYHWGTSLFGFVAVVMIPIPFVRHIPSLDLVVLLIRLRSRCCSGKGRPFVLTASLPHKSSTSNDRCSDILHVPWRLSCLLPLDLITYTRYQ